MAKRGAGAERCGEELGYVSDGGEMRKAWKLAPVAVPGLSALATLNQSRFSVCRCPAGSRLVGGGHRWPACTLRGLV